MQQLQTSEESRLATLRRGQGASKRYGEMENEGGAVANVAMYHQEHSKQVMLGRKGNSKYSETIIIAFYNYMEVY